MTIEKTPTTRKTSTRKATPKPAVVKAEEVVETPKATPARTKRIEIDRNEMIQVRSTTNGTLIYISDRTRARYIWSDYGVIQHIDMGELIDMRASRPRFMNEVRIVIDDEEAAEYLGLTKKYEDLVGIDDLDEFFAKDYDELAKILPKLPIGLKKTISTRARKLIEEKKLDSINKIELLERTLQVDLQMFRK